MEVRDQPVLPGAIEGALKAAGDEALLLMHQGGGRFVALHTTAEGEGTQAELGETGVARLLPCVGAEGNEDPYEISERVRELILHPEEEQEAYQNKGLFSDDYLKHRLTDPVSIPSGLRMFRKLARNCWGFIGRRRNT